VAAPKTSCYKLSQIHEVLGLEERGHDYFIQFTDARPDTGGLSGATPSEAVSWGKIDPEELPTIVCYTDSTIALPLLTAYAINQCQPRCLKRLYDRREEMLENSGRLPISKLSRPKSQLPSPRVLLSNLCNLPCGRLIPNTLNRFLCLYRKHVISGSSSILLRRLESGANDVATRWERVGRRQ